LEGDTDEQVVGGEGWLPSMGALQDVLLDDVFAELKPSIVAPQDNIGLRGTEARMEHIVKRSTQRIASFFVDLKHALAA
jgi:hypothetical protein